MKAISKRQHGEIITALQQLHVLEQGDVLPAGGFIEHIQTLNEHYSQYTALLEQLANCIAEYEYLHKNIRVNVVAPALRKARRQLAI